MLAGSRPWYLLPQDAQGPSVVKIEFLLLPHVLVLLRIKTEAVKVEQRHFSARRAQVHGIAAVRLVQHGLPGTSAAAVPETARVATAALHFSWALLHVLPKCDIAR